MSSTASASVRYALPGLVLGAVLIGLAPIFVRLAGVGPTAAAFWRVFFGIKACSINRLKSLRTLSPTPTPADMPSRWALRWFGVAAAFRSRGETLRLLNIRLRGSKTMPKSTG